MQQHQLQSSTLAHGKRRGTNRALHITQLPKLRRSTSGGKGVPTNAKVITNIHDNYSANTYTFTKPIQLEGDFINQ